MARYYQGKPVTADGQVVTGKGILTGVRLRGGSDAATLDLYDGTSTGGRLIWLGGAATLVVDQWSAPGADAGDGGGIPFEVGIYADISGTSAKAVVYFGMR